VLGGLIVSALKAALTVTRFGKRLVLREKIHGAPKGSGITSGPETAGTVHLGVSASRTLASHATGYADLDSPPSRWGSRRRGRRTGLGGR